MVLENKELKSTSSQQSPHSTTFPHSAISQGAQTSRTTCSQHAPHLGMSILQRDYGHEGNFLVTCWEEVGSMWRASGGGYYVGWLCIMYREEVGIMLISHQYSTHIFSVPHKFNSTLILKSPLYPGGRRMCRPTHLKTP